MACLYNNFAIYYLIGFSTLIIRLHAKWGRFKLTPLYYNPPSPNSASYNATVAKYGQPQFVQLALFFTTGYPLAVVYMKNDGRDRKKIWFNISNPTVPHKFTANDSVVNPEKFNSIIPRGYWFRCNLYSINGTKKISYMVETAMVGLPGFIWKPYTGTFKTSQSGCELGYTVTTVCDKDWFGISCDKRCYLRNPNTTFCDQMGKRVCKSGFDGIPCEDINECYLRRCRHGSTCINLFGSFHCICTRAFTGKRCEISVDNCKPNPCLNGGTCKNTFYGVKCFCVKPLYEGERCEKRNVEVVTDDDLQKSVAVVVSFSLILMAAGTLLFLMRTYLLPGAVRKVSSMFLRPDANL